ncbi:PREDICTED: PHD finger protein 14 isoform X2 [Dinoponera quadriceps]|uniref:PHD finger protein 14 isoform X2 n=1 Tax=Dinoponera quadriceps TaxID=609295 RepID=A0A6P3X633_DINQU|nr:PREDICTED: PHD finger protein 14 isoform X2 [Dinoponera quadriceps]
MSQDDVGFLYKTMIERDPKKRKVKPVESAQQSLLDFDLGESSDDSDFRIEDHSEESDDDSVDSNDVGKEEEAESEESDDDLLEDPLLGGKHNANLTVGDVMEQARQQALKSSIFEEKLNKLLICCGCLGDRSDDTNEIVECDGCGVSVHEGCYGVSDVESFSSTDSLCQSAPWFCEACSAGIEDPSCELCPNKGGIFKETDVGKWVHLVCALYVPGVAFGEVDRLTSVTLFEMQYTKWGAKQCSLCEDSRYARTGVCIECDAGLCHTYFHVTCAQREGLLSEAHSEEVDQADPFYAHCKLHSDKSLVRRRRRNFLAFQLRVQQRQQMLKQPNHLDTDEHRRIERKLGKHRHKYLAHKASRQPPWVPTQKMPRLLTTSASACRQLARKAELMDVDTTALEAQEAQVVALVDVRKKWHIAPAFSVEFIGYYLDRNLRMTSMKRRLQELLDINSQLLNEEQKIERKYKEVKKDKEERVRMNTTLKEKIEMYHLVLKNAGYTKPLPLLADLLTKPKIAPTLGTGTGGTLGVPTAAALKMGVGFPLTMGKGAEGAREGRVLSSQAQEQNHKGELTLRHQCGICRRSTNQHLLAKCDTCHLHYHLSCLSPPLSRMPKKTRLMGWQCSECDKESSGSEVEHVDTSAPRKLRHCKDDANMTLTPPQETSATLSTPTTSKNSSSSVTNVAVPDTPTTPKLTIKPMGPQPTAVEPAQAAESAYNQQSVNNITITRAGSPEYMVASADGTESVSQRSGKKRRREKHKRYTPDPITGVKQRKRKHKRKSLDIENPEVQSQPEVHRRITIKIKPIPRPEGEVASESSPQMFVATSTSTEITLPPPPLPPPAASVPPPPPPPPVNASVNSSSRWPTGTAKRGKDTDLLTQCKVCDTPGTNQNLVMCDECKKCYHFTCLDPPVKKSPKRRGYSWHCADCDPSE